MIRRRFPVNRREAFLRSSIHLDLCGQRIMTFPMRSLLHILIAMVCFAGSLAHAQAPALPPGDPEPLLRLEPNGPTSYVTALTFSADGKRLYAAGFDKVVRVWTLNAAGK